MYTKDIIRTKLNIFLSITTQHDIKKKVRVIRNFSFNNKKYETSL